MEKKYKRWIICVLFCLCVVSLVGFISQFNELDQLNRLNCPEGYEKIESADLDNILYLQCDPKTEEKISIVGNKIINIKENICENVNYGCNESVLLQKEKESPSLLCHISLYLAILFGLILYFLCNKWGGSWE